MFLAFFGVTISLYYTVSPTCVSWRWMVPAVIVPVSTMLLLVVSMLLLLVNMVLVVIDAATYLLSVIGMFLHRVQEATGCYLTRVLVDWTSEGNSVEPMTEGGDIYSPPYYDIVSYTSPNL
jgi:hypothetical protein